LYPIRAGNAEAFPVWEYPTDVLWSRDFVFVIWTLVFDVQGDFLLWIFWDCVNLRQPTR
jgi:hypothetical protein